MHKYALLVYKYLAYHAHKFDYVTVPDDAIEFWPTSSPVQITDAQGQVQYQWPDTIFFKIVEHMDFGETQEAAVAAAVAAWNADPANASRQIPEGFQLVFTEAEALGIKAIFEAERQRLINLL